MPWSPDQSSGIFMIENVGHDIKTENTFEEYPIEETTFNNFYIDEQNDGKSNIRVATMLIDDYGSPFQIPLKNRA